MGDNYWTVKTKTRLDHHCILFGYVGVFEVLKFSNDEPSNEESKNNLNDLEWFEPPPLPLIHFDVIIFVPPSCKDKCVIHFDWGNHPDPCKHGLLPRNWLHSSLIANLLRPQVQRGIRYCWNQGRTNDEIYEYDLYDI